ncbi:MAG: DoxX family protein [Thermoanaerobaculia bacterium]|nr:DoxX family protein [Thermoanaerobaculia bacterium]
MEAKTKNVILWVVSALLAVGFVFAGAAKVVVDPAAAAENFEALGFPGGMAMFIGICEIAGGIGLLVPRLAGLAASGLVIIMIGAVYVHVANTPLAEAIPALVMGLLCVFVVYSRGLPFGSKAAA